jgi:hypothetical protein
LFDNYKLIVVMLLYAICIKKVIYHYFFWEVNMINLKIITIIIIFLICNIICYSEDLINLDISVPNVISNNKFKFETNYLKTEHEGDFCEYIFTNLEVNEEKKIGLEEITLKKINDNSIKPRFTTIDDLINILGIPSLIIIRKQISTNNLSYNYYYGKTRFFTFHNDVLNEIRIENDNNNFVYKNGLKIGLDYHKIIEILGQPKRIEAYNWIKWEDEVLYLNDENNLDYPNEGYIQFNRYGIRIFIFNNKIVSIYFYYNKPNSI